MPACTSGLLFTIRQAQTAVLNLRYRKCAICNCSRVYDFDCVIIFASYGNALNTLPVIVYINFSVGMYTLKVNAGLESSILYVQESCPDPNGKRNDLLS